jgi:hypothetical protein
MPLYRANDAAEESRRVEQKAEEPKVDVRRPEPEPKKGTEDARRSVENKYVTAMYQHCHQKSSFLLRTFCLLFCFFN